MPFIGAAFWSAFLTFLVFAAKRIIVALGFGYLSYQGLKLLADQVKQQVLQSLEGVGGGFAADAYQIVALAGGFEVVGIMLGALIARAALVATGKFINIGMESAHE